MPALKSTLRTFVFLCIFSCSTPSEPPPHKLKTTIKSTNPQPVKPMGSTVPKPHNSRPEAQPSNDKLKQNRKVIQSERPVLKFFVKVEESKSKKTELGNEIEWATHYRTSFIEGDSKKPSRITTLLEGSEKCGSIDSMTDEGAGEDKPGIIYFLNCWNAGAGYTFTFFRRGQTITIEKNSVNEDEANTRGPDDGILHTIEVPKNAKIEFEILSLR